MTDEPTTSDRLKRTIRAKGWSVRQFQIACQKHAPDARGVSYASVYDHVKGRTRHDPPLAFLRAAAHVLDVPLSWLICDTDDIADPLPAHVTVEIVGVRYLVTDITSNGDMVLRRVT